MKENNKINWREYPEFIDLIYDRLLTKKLVALFDDFNKAEGDLFLELFPCVCDEADLGEKIWEYHKNDIDVNKWFDGIGINKQNN